MKLKIKSIVIFFIIAGLFCTLTAQDEETGKKKPVIAYHDALELSDCVDSMQANGRVTFKKEDATDVLKILFLYDDFENFEGNPFIDIRNLESFKDDVTLIEPKAIETEREAEKGIEPLIVAKAVGKVHKFLVEQINKELVITFFTNFIKDFESDKYEPLRVLFPQTYRQLDKIGGEIRNVSLYIDTLQDIFRMDLENIYGNYPALLGMKTDYFKKYLKKKPELKIILSSAMHLADSLLIKNKDTSDTGTVLADFDTSIFNEVETKKSLLINTKHSLELLKIFSASLKKKGYLGESYWIDAGSLKTLFKKKEKTKVAPFHIYLGLIYQQTRGIEFIANKTISAGPIKLKIEDVFKKLQEKPATMDELRSIIENFLSRAILSQAAFNKVKECMEVENPLDSLPDKYYLAAVDVLDFAATMFDFSLATLIGKGAIDVNRTPGPGKYLKLTRNIGETYLDIDSQKYNSIVLNALSIFDEIFAELENKKIFKKNRLKILKYGALMAKIVDTGLDSDKKEAVKELANAIKSIVYPVGSYSHKRNSPFSISLNAYLGLTVSDEHLEGDREKKILQNIDGLYAWAPIGIAFSARTRIGFIGSTSLFFSAIDLGAVAAFRLEGADYDDIPQFNFKNIIAPGAHLVLGLKKYPVSFGAGFQYGPQLRIIELGDEEIKSYEPGAWRFNIFAAIDIPIFNLK